MPHTQLDASTSDYCVEFAIAHKHDAGRTEIRLNVRPKLETKVAFGAESTYRRALQFTGKVVALVGVTLAAGVVTWIFSPTEFQTDMGILLTFMFVSNMIGGLILIPALRAYRRFKVARQLADRERLAHSELGIYIYSASRCPLHCRSPVSLMPRFICPHCHRPLAADSLEAVRCGEAVAWACPCCDGLIPQAPDTHTVEPQSKSTDRATVAPAESARA